MKIPEIALLPISGHKSAFTWMCLFTFALHTLNLVWSNKMENDNSDNVKTQIWITSRCRMIAEKRFRIHNIVCHLLLSWLSISVLSWSIARYISIPDSNADIYVAILTALILVFSVFVFGFKFGETAILHRECYLRLQNILECEDNDKLGIKYREILNAYPNHSEWDFLFLIFNRKLMRGIEIKDSKGCEIKLTTCARRYVKISIFLYIVLVIALLFLGAYTYYIIYKGLV